MLNFGVTNYIRYQFEKEENGILKRDTIWLKVRDLQYWTTESPDALYRLKKIDEVASMIRNNSIREPLQNAFPKHSYYDLARTACMIRKIQRQLADDHPPVRLHGKDTPLGIGMHITKNEVYIDRKKRVIGQGGFKKVKLCTRLSDGLPYIRAVAQKVGAYEIEALERFKNESGIAPAEVIRFKDKRGIRKYAFIQRVYAGDLRQTLLNPKSKRYVELLPKEKIRIAKQLLEGLAEIAKHGAHGDIKPQNALLDLDTPDNQPRAVITDFGSYSPDNRDLPSWQGTWAYLSPEILQTKYHGDIPSQEMLKSADVWAMGMLFLQLFDRKPLWHPHKKLSCIEIYENILRERPRLEFSGDPLIGSLISDMLHIDWKERLTAQQALERLNKIMADS